MKKIFNSRAILLLSLAMFLLATSCNKNKDNVAPTIEDHFTLLGVIEKYYKVFNTKVDGKFMFESNLTNNDPALTNISLAGGIFYDKNANLQTGGGLVSIGNNQWMPNSNGTYGFDKALPQKGLFGTNVTFTLTPPATHNIGIRTTSTNTVTATIYSPLPISIKNIPPRTPITLVPNQNTTLTWNADPNDANGVIIIAEYLPSRYINKSALSAGNTHLIETTMLVTDNGSTSIPWSFFSKFPVGGHIILWVARGNYTIAANGIYNYQVGGYSAAAVWDVKVPQPAPPAINGSSSVYFSSSVTSNGGTITAVPGSLVTVTISASGPPNGNIYPTIIFNLLSNLQFTSGGTSIKAVSTTNTATFTMPSTGTVNWNGTYSQPYSAGSGTISVN